MKTEFKRLNQKLNVFGNIGTTVSLNMTSDVPCEEPQDIEIDLTNEEVEELIETLQSLVL